MKLLSIAYRTETNNQVVDGHKSSLQPHYQLIDYLIFKAKLVQKIPASTFLHVIYFILFFYNKQYTFYYLLTFYRPNDALATFPYSVPILVVI